MTLDEQVDINVLNKTADPQLLPVWNSVWTSIDFCKFFITSALVGWVCIFIYGDSKDFSSFGDALWGSKLLSTYLSVAKRALVTILDISKYSMMIY